MANQEKIKILYIDDEPNNLIGFKATFRFDYSILTADTISEAYQHLEQHRDIRIIFCDQKMPEKTGVQFFEEMMKIYPHPVRILLTGYADIEAVIEAINRSNIFRYIKKPWTEAEITATIGEGNRYYLVNSMIAIKNEELQKAYDELDKFAYSVTHDIRRPLLSILGAIDVAQYIDNITEMKEMLQMMEESVKNLDVYIQNIHDYYNLKRGELIIENINFMEMADEQREAFKSFIKLRNIRFIVKVSQEQTYRNDKSSLTILLSNLLSNAIKYQDPKNPDKYVELNINVESGKAVITVMDNGIGIQENQVPHIFKMFFRATTAEIGSGFGLYNVQNAATNLNGSIKVNTTVGKGSVFTLTIPSK